jgi:hypothetical protein
LSVVNEQERADVRQARQQEIGGSPEELPPNFAEHDA